MIDELLTKQIVEAVVAELRRRGIAPDAPSPMNADGAPAVDITSPESRRRILLQNPRDPSAMARMKRRTNARIGVGRAGARYNTQTLLTLRADHAAARDSVFTDVDERILDDLGLFTVESQVSDKDKFLTRPDLGRMLSDEAVVTIRERCIPNPDIQIFASDGLSSAAISANLPDLLPCLLDGLSGRGLSIGTPFFVRNGRVAVMEPISLLLGAKVICVLIGERPGLATAESMSAYIAYGARIGMEESLRTVVSNIHRGGIPAVEAGAYLADLLCRIFEAGASGVNFKRGS
ncbi:MAG: ethanolamine ammonia-lyase subunit EutC [Synergistaceae bacterium]|jgi:ethanolamine ammonia-lyase small subunit|nr:ethanolamine ammonia-lyase subunit EutC [Synergistaceae bacterium]